MPEIIRDIPQNSPEWMALRQGSVGGSSISAVLAKGKGNAKSKMRQGLLYKLAGEIITGTRDESYTNKFMERGHLWEPKARAHYEWENDCDVEQVALIKSSMPRVHVSPDGLVGDDGGIEIKTMLPHVFIELLDTEKIDGYHIKQCQHFLMVSGRKWIDYVPFCPEFPNPMWVKRLYRDEEMIRTIEAELVRFLKELDALLGKIGYTAHMRKLSQETG